MNPLVYLKQAQENYPQLKFAWGLIGIVAAAAIIASLFKNPMVVVPIVVLMIVGMFVLGAFALSRIPGKV